ncbi:MAG: hypothetical protein UY72_C0002G0012 [Candidatus Uhrbacteria bacterium GW2011_GWD2_52_7]|uniref:Uncharacterized protein n=1 Tax=Candidatus Uhrbacteria bacterium GW2011_GWD2_52_7 TaxID=1618989 RepID=A0A0G1ZRF4_9BACT|nr:MAG: hypothetical protein UY72_C0002G0012 [Candidatus Uhrbacteria bacterium GW2011_GWD2_52_7]
MFDIRALSLAFGSASAVIAIIALLIFGGVAGLGGALPEMFSGASGFWAGVLTVIGAFIQGAISGAIIGSVYNRSEEADWSESVESDRGTAAAV